MRERTVCLASSIRTFCRTRGQKLRTSSLQFLREERGEVGPVGYLLALIPALIFILFAFDLGLRKGTRLAVEYAAYCAARAAAVQLPRGEEERGGAVASQDEIENVRRAAAACLASVSRKRTALSGQLNPFRSVIDGIPLPFVTGAAINGLVERTIPNVSVRFVDGASGSRDRFAADEVVTVEVTYSDPMTVPLSPFNWLPRRPLVARAQAMLQTVR